jgi:hypothetical protein
VSEGVRCSSGLVETSVASGGKEARKETRHRSLHQERTGAGPCGCKASKFGCARGPMFASDNVLLRIPVLPNSAGSVAPQRGAGMAVNSKIRQWVMLFTHWRLGLSQVFLWIMNRAEWQSALIG